MIIVFEGLPGAGKSTQIKNLHQCLLRTGIKSVIHPSDYPITLAIEKLAKKHPFLSLERDLFFWIIRETKELVLRNELKKYPQDAVVLVDRLWGSLIAYSARSIKAPWPFWKNLAQNFLQPDLALFLDVNYKTACQRKNSPTLQKPKAFQELRKNYLKLAKDFKWKILDCNKKEDVVFKEIKKIIKI